MKVLPGCLQQPPHGLRQSELVGPPPGHGSPQDMAASTTLKLRFVLWSQACTSSWRCKSEDGSAMVARCCSRINEIPSSNVFAGRIPRSTAMVQWLSRGLSHQGLLKNKSYYNIFMKHLQSLQNTSGSFLTKTYCRMVIEWPISSISWNATVQKSRFVHSCGFLRTFAGNLRTFCGVVLECFGAFHMVSGGFVAFRVLLVPKSISKRAQPN